MNELWGRIKIWIQHGSGITMLLCVGLFTYLWWDRGLRAALLVSAAFAVVMMSFWLCSRLWIVLLLEKRFSRMDAVFLVLTVACAAAIFVMVHPAMAIGMPLPGVIMSLPALIAAIKARNALKDMSDGK